VIDDFANHLEKDEHEGEVNNGTILTIRLKLWSLNAK